MTPERIAEIERELPDYSGDGDELAEMRELIRLARLGLRVEGSQEYDVGTTDWGGRSYDGAIVSIGDIERRSPDFSQAALDLVGKRVALVVREDST